MIAKGFRDFAAIPQKEPIVIALSSSLASTFILSILHRFTLEARNYKFEILMLNQHDGAELLQSKKADIVIDLNPTKQKDSHAEKLISAPLKLIYSPKLPMADETRDARLHYLFTNNELAIGYLNEHVSVL
ncbi:LysR substrate-binding domain-containing protein [Kurthia populi]|uniref:LysR substrate-binding domain-containing protein n=1 Tax=Kurthia populi TaxID=1562132 RepID=A0ABW5Y125_9BACL